MMKALLLSVLMMFPWVASAKILFVNNSGTPSCSDATTYANNSSSSPWCTVLRAMRGNTDGNRNTAANASEAAQAGDRVYITAGTYDYTGASYDGGGFGHSPLYEPVNSGTSGNWITFQASGGQVSLTGNNAGSAAQFGTHTAQYIKFIGFSVDQSDSGFRDGNGLIRIATSNVWLEDLVVVGAYTDYGFDDNHAGIMLHGPRSGDCTGAIDNITIRNSTISGFTGTSGRNDAGLTWYCVGSNILFENNDVHSNTTGIYGKSSYTDQTNITIRYNNFYSNGGDAIAMQSFSDWRIYQNIMRDNGGGAFTMMAYAYYVGNDKPTDTYIVNNTMHNNGRGIYFKGTCSQISNNYVQNNLIIDSTHALFTDGGECSSTSHMGSDDIAFDYNFYHGYSNDLYEDDGGGTVATYSTWQSSFGQDANSDETTDPLFTNEAGNVFTLQGGSSAINFGVDILDLDGDESTVDSITVGAYITGSETIGTTGETANIPPSKPTGIGGELVLNEEAF